MERTAGSWQDRLCKQEGFLDFLKQHRAAWSLLQDAELLLDIGSLPPSDVWDAPIFSVITGGASPGESAAFTDPFYSPGSDFIALENDFLTKTDSP